MAFKGSLDTADGATHTAALAVVAQFVINYTERIAFVVLDVFHSQTAYDAGKQSIGRREFAWNEISEPRFSDTFNADAVQLAMRDAKGDLTVFIYGLVVARDPQLAAWQQVADSKPVKKRAPPDVIPAVKAARVSGAAKRRSAATR